MRWLLVLLALNGPAHACDPGDTEMVEAQLLFGRASVSAADWADFLQHSVDATFP